MTALSWGEDYQGGDTEGVWGDGGGVGALAGGRGGTWIENNETRMELRHLFHLQLGYNCSFIIIISKPRQKLTRHRQVLQRRRKGTLFPCTWRMYHENISFWISFQAVNVLLVLLFFPSSPWEMNRLAAATYSRVPLLRKIFIVKHRPLLMPLDS